MSTCNQLDLESLGTWLTMPINFPGTGLHSWEQAHCPVLFLQGTRITTLIIPFSVCGANSWNTQNLLNLKISEGWKYCSM